MPLSRSCQPSLLIKEAQDQPEAPHSLHHVSALGPGEEVQAEAVPVHRRARWVFLLPDPDRDPGEDLVPESPGKSQEAPGGRDGETQDGRRCQDGGSRSGCHRRFTPRLYVTAVSGCHVALWANVLCLSAPPQTHSAHPTFRPVCCSAGLQHVPLIIKNGNITGFGEKCIKGFPQHGHRGHVADIF